MLKQFAIKKEYWFEAGVLILCWLGYALAFSKTWAAYRLHAKLSGQLTQAADLRYPAGYLERKEGNLAHLLKACTADTAAFRSRLIEVVSPLAEQAQCRIVEVPGAAGNPYSTSQYQVQRFALEGSFFALTKLLNALEQEPRAGLVRSVDWQVVSSHGGPQNPDRLVLEVYLEAAK